LHNKIEVIPFGKGDRLRLVRDGAKPGFPPLINNFRDFSTRVLKDTNPLIILRPSGKLMPPTTTLPRHRSTDPFPVRIFGKLEPKIHIRLLGRDKAIRAFLPYLSNSFDSSLVKFGRSFT
jgi:hypothetical protein